MRFSLRYSAAAHETRYGSLSTIIHQSDYKTADTPRSDADQRWEAGRLREMTIEARLYLGNCFCLALAKCENLPTWTADKKWREVADAVKVVAIR